MQAGRASIVDINQAIDRSYISFGARMALKWNNSFFPPMHRNLRALWVQKPRMQKI